MAGSWAAVRWSCRSVENWAAGILLGGGLGASSGGARGDARTYLRGFGAVLEQRPAELIPLASSGAGADYDGLGRVGEGRGRGGGGVRGLESRGGASKWGRRRAREGGGAR